MPRSNYGGKQSSKWILSHVHQVSPLSRILDVGPGVGTYPQLLREPGQYWTGVEAWAPYLKKYNLAEKYDQLVVSDIRFLDWSEVGPLDLVICGDVLEHMTRAEAIKVAGKALSTARIMLIALPLIHAPQGESEDNPFEVHVEEDWTDADARSAFPDWCVGIFESYMGVYMITRNDSDKRLLMERATKLAHLLDRDGTKTVKIVLNDLR